MPHRTTLTLEDAVAKALKEEALKRGVPMKILVNLALKAGLHALSTDQGTKPYRLAAKPLGLPEEGIDLTKSLSIADELENEQLMSKALKG